MNMASTVYTLIVKKARASYITGAMLDKCATYYYGTKFKFLIEYLAMHIRSYSLFNDGIIILQLFS